MPYRFCLETKLVIQILSFYVFGLASFVFFSKKTKLVMRILSFFVFGLASFVFFYKKTKLVMQILSFCLTSFVLDYKFCLFPLQILSRSRVPLRRHTGVLVSSSWSRVPLDESTCPLPWYSEPYLFVFFALFAINQ